MLAADVQLALGGVGAGDVAQAQLAVAQPLAQRDDHMARLD